MASINLEQLLFKYWGYSAFRPLQESIIRHALAGDDVLALLPTGGGKSLCYQLPALAQDGCVLVISPLIALMQDQVARLKMLGIPAGMLSSGMSRQGMLEVMQLAADKELKLLYVSPERLQTPLFKDSLQALNIRLIAVDEAHCISQWGHDFRPDYRYIRKIRRALPGVPVMALTASATPAVALDIREQLWLKGSVRFRESFRRPNIYYSVRLVPSVDTAVQQELKTIAPGASIIYCRSRRQTETLARALQQQGVPAIAYHAGLDATARADRQLQWMQTESSVMVATTAFGMGIDKAGVRLVIHCEPPESLESYYQESGRAGRDGQPARAVLLYQKKNIRKLQESTGTMFPGVPYLREVYQAVCEYLQVPVSAEPPGPLPFDTADFCKKFGLNPHAVKPALNQLAKEGLWILTHTDTPKSSVVFLVDRTVLDGLFASHPALSLLCLWLLRLHADVLHYPAAPDMALLAKKLKLPASKVSEQLELLSKMEILRYQPAAAGGKLWFTHQRVDSRYLLIDTTSLEERREAHQAQTAAMIGFVTENTQCRTAVMLRYFGEELSAPCGQCDYCSSQNKTAGATADTPLQQAMALIAAAGQPLRLASLLSHFPAAAQRALLAGIKESVDSGVLHLPSPTTIALRKKTTG